MQHLLLEINFLSGDQRSNILETHLGLSPGHMYGAEEKVSLGKGRVSRRGKGEQPGCPVESFSESECGGLILGSAVDMRNMHKPVALAFRPQVKGCQAEQRLLRRLSLLLHLVKNCQANCQAHCQETDNPLGMIASNFSLLFWRGHSLISGAYCCLRSPSVATAQSHGSCCTHCAVWASCLLSTLARRMDDLFF